jgi:tetratricopeptide (TPR) repeat protein
MFERAMEADPQYVPAYAGAADCCSFLYMYWDGSKANIEGADTASRKALDLGPDIAEAHAARALALSLSKQYDEAQREFETAIRLNPKLYEAHYFYARASFQQGKHEEAVRQFEEASRVRPDEYQAALLLQLPYHALGRHDDAKAALRRGLVVAEKHLELDPDDARALYLGAGALSQLGERKRSVEWAARALAVDPEDSGVLYNVACAYALAGETHAALDCLEKAIHNGFGHREWIEHDSDLNSLRQDPRFEALLKKL